MRAVPRGLHSGLQGRGRLRRHQPARRVAGQTLPRRH
jgi:hypothetical protein